MNNLSFTLGEVSMTGASYGGLTSCYAVSARPNYFRRAFCQSPSVWWNYGQLPPVIISNEGVNGLPIAVAMYIGTTEMVVPECTSSTCNSTATWFSYVNETANAFLQAGLSMDRLFLFTVDGGQHDVTAWATSFRTGIAQMYQSANWTSIYKMKYSLDSSVNVVYSPLNTTTASTSDGNHNHKISLSALEIFLITLVVLQTILLLMGTFTFYYSPKRKESSKENIMDAEIEIHDNRGNNGVTVRNPVSNIK